MRLKISGIYKIQSTSHPNRIYVGSSVDIKDRWRCHLRDLRDNCHDNPKLQHHYNKYREDDLIFSILTICEKEELKPIDGIIRPEQFFMWAFNPYFNIDKIAGSRKGHKPKKRTIEKMSKAHKGKPAWSKGRTGVFSAEVLKKMSEDKIAFFKTEAGDRLKEKVRESNRNRIESEETRKRRSDSHKGLKQSPETIAKKVEKQKGRKRPQEFGLFISKIKLGVLPTGIKFKDYLIKT